MTKTSYKLKIFSILTSALFFVNALLFSNTALYSQLSVNAKSEAIHLPAALGSVMDCHEGTHDIQIVLIQDAHCNYDAQINIQKTIHYLEKNNNFRLIAFEGGTGKVDLLPLRSFPDRLTKATVFEEYVNRGELSGAEYASLNASPDSKFYGIEDPGAYQENKRAFLKAIDQAKQFEAKYINLKIDLDTKKKQIFNPGLKQFERTQPSPLSLSLEKGEGNLVQYIQFLGDQAKEREIEIADFPNVSLILKRIKEKNKSTLEELKEIQGPEFFKEIFRLRDTLKETYFQNETERKLNQKYQNLELLHKVANLQASREEYETYLRSKNDFQLNLTRAEQFYELSLKRDKLLFRNLKLLLSETKEKSAVLVVGGFHTKGITQQLKKAGISYLVFTPKISRVTDYNLYQNVMKGDVSYLNRQTIHPHHKIDISPSLIQGIQQWKANAVSLAVSSGSINQIDQYSNVIQQASSVILNENIFNHAALAVEAASLGSHKEEFLVAASEDLITAYAKALASGQIQTDQLKPEMDRRLEDWVGREHLDSLTDSWSMLQGLKARLHPEVEKIGSSLRALRNTAANRYVQINLNDPGLYERHLKSQKLLKSLLTRKAEKPGQLDPSLVNELSQLSHRELIKLKIDLIERILDPKKKKSGNGLPKVLSSFDPQLSIAYIDEAFKTASHSVKPPSDSKTKIDDKKLFPVNLPKFLQSDEFKLLWQNSADRLVFTMLLVSRISKYKITPEISRDIRQAITPLFLNLSNEEIEEIRTEAALKIEESVIAQFGDLQKQPDGKSVRPEVRKAIQNWKRSKKARLRKNDGSPAFSVSTPLHMRPISSSQASNSGSGRNPRVCRSEGAS